MRKLSMVFCAVLIGIGGVTHIARADDPEAPGYGERKSVFRGLCAACGPFDNQSVCQCTVGWE